MLSSGLQPFDEVTYRGRVCIVEAVWVVIENNLYVHYCQVRPRDTGHATYYLEQSKVSLLTPAPTSGSLEA